MSAVWAYLLVRGGDVRARRKQHADHGEVLVKRRGDERGFLGVEGVEPGALCDQDERAFGRRDGRGSCRDGATGCLIFVSRGCCYDACCWFVGCISGAIKSFCVFDTEMKTKRWKFTELIISRRDRSQSQPAPALPR